MIIQVPRTVAGEWHWNNLCGNQRLSDGMQWLHASVVVSGVRTHNRLETINGLSTTSQVVGMSVTYILFFFNASSEETNTCVTDSVVTQSSVT